MQDSFFSHPAISSPEPQLFLFPYNIPPTTNPNIVERVKMYIVVTERFLGSRSLTDPQQFSAPVPRGRNSSPHPTVRHRIGTQPQAPTDKVLRWVCLRSPSGQRLQPMQSFCSGRQAPPKPEGITVVSLSRCELGSLETAQPLAPCVPSIAPGVQVLERHSSPCNDIANRRRANVP